MEPASANQVQLSRRLSTPVNLNRTPVGYKWLATSVVVLALTYGGPIGVVTKMADDMHQLLVVDGGCSFGTLNFPRFISSAELLPHAREGGEKKEKKMNSGLSQS